MFLVPVAPLINCAVPIVVVHRPQIDPDDPDQQPTAPDDGFGRPEEVSSSSSVFTPYCVDQTRSDRVIA